MTDNNGQVTEDPIEQELRDRIAKDQEQADALQLQLGLVNGRITRYERALRVLTGEKIPGRGRPSRAAGADRTRGPLGGKGISDEALEQVKEDILRFAQDHEEFRQVDIRTMQGAAVPDSGKLSTAFKILRQDDHNFLRFARKDGNNLYFRLTRQAAELVKK